MGKKVNFGMDYLKERSEQDENGCLNWKLSKNREGLPVCSLNIDGTKAKYIVTRLAYAKTKGILNESNIVFHTCGNIECVNPDHLKEGTIDEKNKLLGKLGKLANLNKKGESNQLGNNRAGKEVTYKGKKYESLTKAAEKYGISPNGMKKRINKEKSLMMK